LISQKNRAHSKTKRKKKSNPVVKTTKYRYESRTVPIVLLGGHQLLIFLLKFSKSSKFEIQGYNWITEF
jgi:hypothetical protein